MAKCRISFDHFTKEQVEELSSQLAALSKKDTDFPAAEELDGSERLAIVQSGENVLATMDDVSDIVADKVEPVIMTSENIVNALGYTPYEKPDNGIPKSDLATSVRTSLDKADTALQAETDPTVPSWAKQSTKPSYDYSEIDNTPDLSNFITNTVDNLVNYYKKSETYNRTEVNNLISTIQGFTYLLVDSLPTASADTMGKIYLVPSADQQQQNVKDEYITIESSDSYNWEQIGSTAVDLSGYVTTTALNTILAGYVTTTNLTTLLNGKQDTLISGTNIKTVNGQSIVGSGDADVRSDWTETSSSAASFIKHKPNVAIIEAETSQLSPLTLESTANKVTSISAQSTDIQYPSAKAVYDAIQGGGGSVTDAVKYTEQSLTSEQKAQARTNIGAGTSNFSGNYDDLTNKPTIPDKLADLQDDSTHRLVTDTEKSTWNGKYTKPQTGIPATDLASGVIPDVSQFITKSVNDLTNYYLKTETYTQTEVNNLIGAIQQFHYEVAASTSAVTNPQSNVLYLIGPTGSGSDKYEEYVYPDATTGWVKIGDTSIDLSGYVTTTALNTALADYVTSTALATALAAKQDVIDAQHKLDYSLLSNTPTIPDAVEANPTVPSGTTSTSLTGVKIGSDYYDIEAGGGTVTDVQMDGISIVDSNGVADIETEEVSAVTIDTVVTQGSSNPVTSGAVYNVLGDIATILASI